MIIKTCSSCGKENLSTDKFCKECGIELEECYLFCSQCGTKNLETNNNCSDCGNSLHKTIAGKSVGSKELRVGLTSVLKKLAPGCITALIGTIITLIIGMAVSWGIRSYAIRTLVKSIPQDGNVFALSKDLLSQYLLGTYNIYGLLHSASVSLSGLIDLNLKVPREFGAIGHADFVINVGIPIILTLIIPIIAIVIGWVIANSVMKLKPSYKNVLVYSVIYMAFVVLLGMLFNTNSHTQSINLQSLADEYSKVFGGTGLIDPKSTLVLKTVYQTSLWSMVLNNFVLILFLATGLHFSKYSGIRFLTKGRSFFEQKLGSIGSGMISSINVYLVLVVAVGLTLGWLSISKTIFGASLQADLSTASPQFNLIYWLLFFPFMLFQTIPLLLGGQFKGVLELPQVVKMISPTDSVNHSLSLNLFKGLTIDGKAYDLVTTHYLMVLIPIVTLLIAGFLRDRQSNTRALITKSITFSICFSLITNLVAAVFKTSLTANVTNLKFVVDGLNDVIKVPSMDSFSAIAGNSFGYGFFTVLFTSYVLFFCGGVLAMLLYSKESSS